MVTPYTFPPQLIGYVPPWTVTICFSSKWLIYINKLFSVEIRNEKHLMRELLNCVSGKLWFEAGFYLYIYSRIQLYMKTKVACHVPRFNIKHLTYQSLTIIKLQSLPVLWTSPVVTNNNNISLQLSYNNNNYLGQTTLNFITLTYFGHSLSNEHNCAQMDQVISLSPHKNKFVHVSN